MADAQPMVFKCDVSVPVALGAIDRLGRFIGPLCDYRDPHEPNGPLLAFPVYEGDSMEPVRYEMRYFVDPEWWDGDAPCPVEEPDWVTVATVQGTDMVWFARQFSAAFRALLMCQFALERLRSGEEVGDYIQHNMEWALRTAGMLSPKGLEAIKADPEPWASCERPKPNDIRMPAPYGAIIMTEPELFEWEGFDFYTCVGNEGLIVRELTTGFIIPTPWKPNASREDVRGFAIATLEKAGREKVAEGIESAKAKLIECGALTPEGGSQ